MMCIKNTNKQLILCILQIANNLSSQALYLSFSVFLSMEIPVFKEDKKKKKRHYITWPYAVMWLIVQQMTLVNGNNLTKRGQNSLLEPPQTSNPLENMEEKNLWEFSIRVESKHCLFFRSQPSFRFFSLPCCLSHYSPCSALFELGQQSCTRVS